MIGLRNSVKFSFETLMAAVKRRGSGETGAAISETCFGFEAVRSEALSVLRRWVRSDINKCHGAHIQRLRGSTRGLERLERAHWKPQMSAEKKWHRKRGLPKGGWRTAAPHLEAPLCRSTVLKAPLPACHRHPKKTTVSDRLSFSRPRSSRRARTWRRRTPPCGRR